MGFRERKGGGGNYQLSFFVFVFVFQSLWMWVGNWPFICPFSFLALLQREPGCVGTQGAVFVAEGPQRGSCLDSGGCHLPGCIVGP